MKKEWMLAGSGILLIAFFFLAFFFFPQTGITGSSVIDSATIIDGSATVGSSPVSLVIIASHTNSSVPTSGNYTPESAALKEIIPLITNLTAGWQINMTLHGPAFPSSWTEREPNSTEAGSKKIEFFEVAINDSTAGGSYSIYFNVTQEKLGNLPAANISLFLFNDSAEAWENLSTTVVDGTADPASFYAISSHFSKFFIGQWLISSGGGGNAEPGTPSGGATSGGGGGGGGRAAVGEAIATAPLPVKMPRKAAAKELPQPVHKPGILFDVSVDIPEKYQQVLPGAELVAGVRVINIKNVGQVSVPVEYTIEDLSGTVFFKEVETKTIEVEVSYLKEIKLPLHLVPGIYMFFVRLHYENDTAIAGYPFTVVAKQISLVGRAAGFAKQEPLSFSLSLIGVVAVVVLLLLYFLHLRKRQPVWKAAKKPTAAVRRERVTDPHLQQLRELIRKR